MLPKELEGKSLTIIGTIDSIPILDDNSVKFEFKPDGFNKPEGINNPEGIYKQWENPGKILLHWHHHNTNKINSPPKVGEKWQFTVKLKRPHGYANPGSFDKEKYFFQHRLVAEGYIIDKNKLNNKINSNSITNNIVNNNIFYFHYSIEKFRSYLKDTIQKALQQENDFNENQKNAFSGLVIALVVGLQDGINQDQWEVFRKTGTAHLMAISGLHVGLVAGVIFFIVNFLWRRLPLICLNIPAKWVAALAAILGALLYALLAGFSIPTQRALVMVTVFMSSLLTRRVLSPWRSYFLALGIVIIIDPFSILSAGFWLSFGAVGIILYALRGRIRNQGVKDKHIGRNHFNNNHSNIFTKIILKKIFNNLWSGWGRTQWIAFLGLMPITLFCFQSLSLISPLANSIAIPWVSFLVVPLSLLGSVLILFNDSLGQFFLLCAEKCLEILWPILQYFAENQYASWTNAEIAPWGYAAAILGVFLILAPKGLPIRHLGLVCLLPLCFSKSPKIPFGEASFTVLDVGQGLSVVVETKNHTLVFDTGPKLNVVVPYLATRGINKIDTLIISHGDNDHIGGMDSILNSIPVERIVSSDPEKVEKQISNNNNKNNESINKYYKKVTENIDICIKGKQWEWDGIQFEIMHPNTLENETSIQGIKRRKRNNYSCVLKLENEHHSVLLTGDIEAKGEKQILEQNKDSESESIKDISKLKSSIMLVPHHGSKSSSTMEFIEAVDPEYAIIPAGYRNRYGHPKPEVVARYQKSGIQVLNTAEEGMIQFMLKNQKPLELPYRYRRENQKFWN